jgi:ubiquinone/menaquinone biosynthesis C-methylase UbiE
LRRLFDNPADMLGNLVRPGLTVLELGPGNGYFSVPIAEALKGSGQLIAVDAQPQMLRLMSRRLQHRGLAGTLVTRLTRAVDEELTDLADSVDLVVAINVVHELPKPRETLVALARTLRVGARLLLAEPRGHVSLAHFETEQQWLLEAGLVAETGGSQRKRGLRAVFLKTANVDSRQ